MSDKEFVTYEQALALKELGFDEPCFGRWLVMTEWEEPTGEVILQIGLNAEIWDKKQCSAPIYSQAFRWFREKYNYNHSIIFHKHPFGTNDYQYMIVEDDEWVEVNFNTYEEAENACIDKLIEIAKQQDNEQ